MKRHIANLAIVRDMHMKFGINHLAIPIFTSEEAVFRKVAMHEELDEYLEANSDEDRLDALVDLYVFALGTIERAGKSLVCEPDFAYAVSSPRTFPTAENAVDYMKRIIDNSRLHPEDMTANSATICHISSSIGGYSDGVFNAAFDRVMAANCQKEVGTNAKRGDFAIDLVKPEGWKSPDLSDLVSKSVISERGGRYGSFEANAKLTQNMSVLLWSSNQDLDMCHREAMHMICHKIARMLCGVWYYDDNAVDISGYAQLLKTHVEQLPATAPARSSGRHTDKYHSLLEIAEEFGSSFSKLDDHTRAALGSILIELAYLSDVNCNSIKCIRRIIDVADALADHLTPIWKEAQSC